MEPVFFTSGDDFHAWLWEQHNQAGEIVVGFYKKSSHRKGITYAEALDAALCFGLIDGIRKAWEKDSYIIRFTPRKKGSIWSDVNIRRVEELAAEGRMQPAGKKAFEARKEERSRVYSYEADERRLSEDQEAIFQQNEKAWAFWQKQAPSYRKAASWWVISAKQEATRERRLQTLIADSEAGRTIAPLTRKGKD